MGAFDDMRRVAELSAILIRHGLGELVGRIGLEKTMRSAGYVAASPGSEVSNGSTLPGRLRQALEEMGPTFVKLGQILSTRVDLLPPAYIAELCKLRSAVSTVPFEALVNEVEANLGHPLATEFAEIGPIALAGGSIAQVHRARLHSGGEVILKIRRPGIGAIIETDLRLLMRLANVAVAESDEIRRFRPREIVTEFARSIRRELDLANECHNAERIAENFRDMSYIHVPRVHWEWTSERMNVQDMASGLPGTDLDAVRAAGLDLRIIAARGTEAVLKMIFEDRFFHADPHPGNVFYRAGDEIEFIDFGMVGNLARQRRDELVDLLTGVVDRRPEIIVRTLLDWSGAEVEDTAGLSTRIDTFIDRVHGLPLKALNPSALALELIALIREHGLVLPPDLTLAVKAFTSLEGMGRELDPDFDMVAAAQPFLHRLIAERYSPFRLARGARDGLVAGAGLMNRLPSDISDFLNAARRGNLRLGIDLRQVDRLAERFDRAVTRMTVGILIAALIMGSSIVMTVAGGDLPIGVTFFAMLGFFGSIAGALWLLWSVLRRKGD